jgi:hypothetical protein
MFQFTKQTYFSDIASGIQYPLYTFKRVFTTVLKINKNLFIIAH